MDHLRKSLFIIALLRLSIQACNELVDKYHFTRLNPAQYVKHSEKYNLDLLVNFDNVEDYNTIKYKNQYYRAVSFLIDNPEKRGLLSSTDRPTLKIANEVTQTLSRTFDCSIYNERYLNADNGSKITKRVNNVNKNNDVYDSYYYFNRDAVDSLETLLYNSYADHALPLVSSTSVCFALNNITKRDKFEFMSGQIYINMHTRALRDLLEFISSLNNGFTYYSFDEFYKNHYHYLFSLGFKGLMANPTSMVIDKDTKINYGFEINIGSFATYLKQQEKIVQLFEAPFKMYSEAYDADNRQDTVLKAASSFYLMIIYSLFAQNRDKVEMMPVNELLQAFITDTYNYINEIKLGGEDAVPVAIDTYASSLVKYIPLVSIIFSSIFNKDDSSIIDKVELLHPTFLDSDGDSGLVESLLADKANHEVGKHLIGMSSFDNTALKIILDVINTHVAQDYQTILDSALKIGVMYIAIGLVINYLI